MNTKTLILVGVTLLLGFLAGDFYGGSGKGRYELKGNAYVFDTKTGNLKPVEDWKKLPIASP